MKSKAIVLRTFKYTDDSLIAHLLTEEAGCVGMLVHISHARKASVRYTLFQPLALLDIEWQERPHASLQHPRSVQIATPFLSIPYNAHKVAIALFLAEFLYYAVRHEPDTHDIYAYVARSIEWFDTCTTEFANFHLVFLLRLTRFLGFLPNAYQASPNQWFDLRTSCFVSNCPNHPDVLCPSDAALVPKLLRMRYETMYVFKFNGDERSRLLKQINRFYRLHIPDFPELKSLSVLESIF